MLLKIAVLAINDYELSSADGNNTVCVLRLLKLTDDSNDDIVSVS